MKRVVRASVSCVEYIATDIEYAGRSCIVMLRTADSQEDVVEYILGQEDTQLARDRAAEFIRSDNIYIPAEISNRLSKIFKL